MSKLIKISNNQLNVEISTLGAELQSIKNDEEKEFLWNGDEKIWAGKAPLLFPLCGGLRDDKYIFGGKEYTLEKHGFARKCEFAVENQSDSSATFLLCSNENILQSFPFEFELRITYLLIENSIEVKYSVLNKSNNKMYFSIGSHEGYSCPEGIEEYSVIFKEHENLDAVILNGNLLEHKAVKIAENTDCLLLKEKYFAVDALIFTDIKSRSVTLKHNKSDKKIKVDFEGFDYLLLWTKPNAPYICIEPWCGIPDYVDSDFDITKKEGIISLSSGEACEKVHKITIE